MQIIVVDDEELAVDNMLSLLRKVEQEAIVIGFCDGQEALDYLSQNSVDIAFLDIEIEGYNGVELAIKCKELCPRINIIFVTGYSQYTMDAFKIHASGYLMKPVREKDLRVEIDNIRHPIIEVIQERMKVQTFGYFEAFVGGIPLHFGRSKSKELFAYLVDRKGTSVTTGELLGILWEDKPNDKNAKSLLRHVVSNMIKTLSDNGYGDIIIKRRNSLAVDISRIDCDFYDFLNGDKNACNMYFGEYMTNYSWSEYTNAYLGQIWIERQR